MAASDDVRTGHAGNNRVPNLTRWHKPPPPPGLPAILCAFAQAPTHIMTSSRFGLLPLLLALPLAAQGTVGEKVGDCTFPTFLNGDGRQSLAEFFGQPVMIDVWGTH